LLPCFFLAYAATVQPLSSVVIKLHSVEPVDHRETLSTCRHQQYGTSSVVLHLGTAGCRSAPRCAGFRLHLKYLYSHSHSFSSLVDSCSGRGGERSQETGNDGTSQGRRGIGTEGEQVDRCRESKTRRRGGRGPQTGSRRDSGLAQNSARDQRGLCLSRIVNSPLLNCFYDTCHVHSFSPPSRR